MTTEADFLAAICAEPHDDTHRLVFADWLEERGEPGDAERAEFIRTQCELAHCPPITDPANHGGQRHDRQRQLFASHGHDWFAYPPLFNGGPAVDIDITALVGTEGGEVVFRRGFVAEVHCSCAVWQRHGPALVRSHPVEVVRLVDVGVALMGAGGRFRYNSQHPEPYFWPWMLRKYGGNLGELVRHGDLAAGFGQSGFGADAADAVHTLVGRAALAWAREQAKLPPLRAR